MLALGLAGWSLYLQRRDRRPRLTFGVHKERWTPRTYIPETGHFAYHDPEWALRIAIRNVGDRRIQIERVAARWIWGAGSIVTLQWEETREIEPDAMSGGILPFKEFPGPASPLERLLPIYRVDFLDHLGRVWVSGFRWIPPSRRVIQPVAPVQGS
jgi:hypothetical protein